MVGECSGGLHDGVCPAATPTSSLVPAHTSLPASLTAERDPKRFVDAVMSANFLERNRPEVAAMPWLSKPAPDAVAAATKLGPVAELLE